MNSTNEISKLVLASSSNCNDETIKQSLHILNESREYNSFEISNIFLLICNLDEKSRNNLNISSLFPNLIFDVWSRYLSLLKQHSNIFIENADTILVSTSNTVVDVISAYVMEGINGLNINSEASSADNTLASTQSKWLFFFCQRLSASLSLMFRCLNSNSKVKALFLLCSYRGKLPIDDDYSTRAEDILLKSLTLKVTTDYSVCDELLTSIQEMSQIDKLNGGICLVGLFHFHCLLFEKQIGTNRCGDKFVSTCGSLLDDICSCCLSTIIDITFQILIRRIINALLAHRPVDSDDFQARLLSVAITSQTLSACYVFCEYFRLLSALNQAMLVKAVASISITFLDISATQYIGAIHCRFLHCFLLACSENFQLLLLENIMPLVNSMNQWSSISIYNAELVLKSIPFTAILDNSSPEQAQIKTLIHSFFQSAVNNAKTTSWNTPYLAIAMILSKTIPPNNASFSIKIVNFGRILLKYVDAANASIAKGVKVGMKRAATGGERLVYSQYSRLYDVITTLDYCAHIPTKCTSDSSDFCVLVATSLSVLCSHLCQTLRITETSDDLSSEEIVLVKAIIFESVDVSCRLLISSSSMMTKPHLEKCKQIFHSFVAAASSSSGSPSGNTDISWEMLHLITIHVKAFGLNLPQSLRSFCATLLPQNAIGLVQAAAKGRSYSIRTQGVIKLHPQMLHETTEALRTNSRRKYRRL